MGNNILIPQGRAGAARRSIQDRKKHPKLIGADIYVTRLLNCTSSNEKCVDGEPSERTCPSPTLSTSSISTGSLHDEITCKEEPCAPTSAATTSTRPSTRATESRPCYRCVAYMDSVGIKRVFWTNGEGVWESAKVRDLVDLLEGSGEGGAEANIGFVVTKHEVLRLRRVFGAANS